MNRKRGQAALEFLTTYGWAFLVILVMIAALAYMGVLDPKQMITDSCASSAPFTCTGASSSVLSAVGAADSDFKIEFKNGLSESVTVSLGSLTVDGVSCGVATIASGATIVGGGSSVVDLTDSSGDLDLCLPIVKKGEKVRFVFEFTYTPTSSTIARSVTGSGVSTAQ